ncbi:MAG: rhodanese-like domain-containing protein [Bdellovibrionaceae bacterium]|nr:rhodanese-like domain-containing protein [Pseudobdellovibrionaceae bacterium]
MDPNPLVVKALNEAGVTQMTEVYLISNHGVRSAAVTWALRKLGYANTRNFAGGYEQVIFKRK